MLDYKVQLFHVCGDTQLTCKTSLPFAPFNGLEIELFQKEVPEDRDTAYVVLTITNVRWSAEGETFVCDTEESVEYSFTDANTRESQLDYLGRVGLKLA